MCPRLMRMTPYFSALPNNMEGPSQAIGIKTAKVRRLKALPLIESKVV
jgi:hypothetical protein